MSDVEADAVILPKKKATKEEKRQEYRERIYRTLIACLMGVVAGIISFLAVDRAHLQGINGFTMLGLLVMIAGVVVQKHIFILARLNTTPLGAKDWLYQGFMTFSLWFITWTILLS